MKEAIVCMCQTLEIVSFMKVEEFSCQALIGDQAARCHLLCDTKGQGELGGIYAQNRNSDTASCCLY